MSLEKIITEVSERVKAGETNLVTQHSDEIKEVIRLLDEGEIRVASFDGTKWNTHAWIKEAILLYFRLQPMEQLEVGPFVYHDKIPLKRNFDRLNVRVVPPATARYGSFMEPGVVLMPSM